MKFTLEIELGNDGMRHGVDIARALHTTATRLGTFGHSAFSHDAEEMIRDTTGNAIGKWEVVPTAGDPHAHIGVGHCPVCGHYGQDCTGKL